MAVLPDTSDASESAPPTQSAAKIIVAIVPTKVDLWRRILAGYEFVVVMTLREAMQRLGEEGLAMVIIGVHFDESRMFGLLEAIRSQTKHRDIPVLGVLSPGQYAFSDIALEGIDRAVNALGASGLLNLDQFPDDARGEGEIRSIVDYLISVGGDLHHMANRPKTARSRSLSRSDKNTGKPTSSRS